MNKHELNFLAIDFETATPDRMACQLGLVYIKDGIAVEKREWLIQPPHNYYTDNTIAVHGITPEDTQYCKTFPDIWKEAKIYFDNAPIIVAHNATFDHSVLIKNLEYYNIAFNECDYDKFECTYKMTGKSLHCLCEKYGINTEGHHDALFDATCCAKFYIALKTGMNVEIHHEDNSHHTYHSTHHYHEQIHGDVLVQDLTGADPDNPFYDKKLVITGEFPQSRHDLAAFFKRMGADVNTCISKRTEIVVVGDDPGPKKMEKLQCLLEQGYEIEIFNKEQIKKIYR